MSLLNRIFGPPKPRDPIAAGRIREWVRASLVNDYAAQQEIIVTVSELECNDIACPGTETVILIMRPYHATRAIKFSMTMDRVTQEDVTQQLAS
jgi:hypothetical protein